MNASEIVLPEGWTLDKDGSGRGPDLLNDQEHVVAVLTLELDYPVPNHPGAEGSGYFNADRWFWDPQPEDTSHVARPGGYTDYHDALKAAVAYVQTREA